MNDKIITIASGIVVIFAVYYLIHYWNYLTGIRNNVHEASSNINVLKRKRTNVIDNIKIFVDTFMQYEKEIYSKIASDMSGNTTALITRLADHYPNLKSDNRYNQLTNELVSVETLIEQRRIEYNKEVKNYNTIITCIPAIFFANILQFKKIAYFS